VRAFREFKAVWDSRGGMNPGKVVDPYPITSNLRLAQQGGPRRAGPVPVLQGCKSDCPVNVDMATYKAEFLHHYYKRRLRPVTAYTVGLIHWGARLAAGAPWAANLATQTPGPALPGQAPRRHRAAAGHPALRARALHHLVPASHPPAAEGRRQVILWPDTFNNYLHPATARAAVLRPPAVRLRHARPGRDRAELLARMGLDVELLDSGCCGMAGSFGFERGEHYQVAVKQGERVLLPRVRGTPADTLVLADGFSCRTQIEQGAGRRALHLAEVLRLAMHGHGEPP
jgi:Fe-S oxidoreductase